MPQTFRRRYPARRRLGFAVSTGRVIASDRSRFFLEISTHGWVGHGDWSRCDCSAKPRRQGLRPLPRPSTAVRALVDAAASMGDLCGFVPSIKFEDAASREYALVRYLRRFWFRHGGHRAGSKIIKDEEADGRRQIALLAVAVDLTDEFGQCHASKARDLLHTVPECLFKADAGLVTRDYDRAFHHGRFHDASSPSIRC